MSDPRSCLPCPTTAWYWAYKRRLPGSGRPRQCQHLPASSSLVAARRRHRDRFCRAYLGHCPAAARPNLKGAQTRVSRDLVASSSRADRHVHKRCGRSRRRQRRERQRAYQLRPWGNRLKGAAPGEQMHPFWSLAHFGDGIAADMRERRLVGRHAVAGKAAKERAAKRLARSPRRQRCAAGALLGESALGDARAANGELCAKVSEDRQPKAHGGSGGVHSAPLPAKSSPQLAACNLALATGSTTSTVCRATVATARKAIQSASSEVGQPRQSPEAARAPLRAARLHRPWRRDRRPNREQVGHDVCRRAIVGEPHREARRGSDALPQRGAAARRRAEGKAPRHAKQPR
mmetsp:Transcript_14417/g.45066  ORF Transcript_14417/g.45066 Transcript_14417/m.45066 type:complete len:347 (+) Transcript_14417:482-1522(+)